MRRASVLLACLALPGCLTTEGATGLASVLGGEVVEQGSRTLARRAVNAAMAEHLPGVDATPVTDCIIDNATTAELAELAGAAGRGAAGDSAGAATAAWPVVRTIATRSETLTCLQGRLSASDLLRIGGGFL